MVDRIIYWESVCGNDTPYDAFWNANLTINAESPDFTKCFEDTVLVWSPCLYLIVASIFYLPYLLRTPTVNTTSEVSGFNIFKVIIGSLLCAVTLADVLKSDVDKALDHGPSLSLFFKPAFLLLCMILATIFINLEFRKGVHSGGVLFFWWLLLLIFAIFEFRTKIILISYDESGSPIIEDVFRFTTFYIYYALVIIQFISSLWADKKALQCTNKRVISGERQPLLSSTEEQTDTPYDDGLPPCPEISTPFWKRLLFIWITKMIVAGYRRSLDFNDLFQLLPRDKCSAVIPRFEKAWKKQLEKTGFKLIHPVKSSDIKPKLNREQFAQRDKLKHAEMHPEVNFSGKEKSKTEKKEGPSTWKAILSSFGGNYMIGGIYKLVYDLLGFLNPQILNLLITFIATQDPLQWRGYVYAAVMFIASMLRTVLLQQYWHSCFVTGMQLRTAVTGAVYRKSLKLNSASRKGATAGEIVNLMSVDAQKLQDAPGFMHMLWSAPLTVALAMYFLWQQLGPSVLAGLGLMLLLVPLNAFIAQKTRKLQIAQMRWKDSRIKLMNEVLNGIKVLKLYAWEDSFKDRVLGIREKELDVLKTAAYLSAASAISWTMAPYLIALGSFAVYVLASPDNILDANKAFVSLSLFNLMNYPLSILPAVIAYGVQASVSIGRITRFLKSEELDPDAISHQAAGDAIIVDRATFGWGRDETPTLKNINLRVPHGHLIAVVGQVGAGKSSIIQSLLGEMIVFSGTINVSGSVAYVPQQAWIQNATLKDNIIFGKTLNDNVYTNVVEACALAPDLKILPGGDQTEIGEKGINLSGGQKQRVSLARAVYQNSDIYLLDDPLSAVDAHVGKHIFEQVVGSDGLLRNKTRVLVTNGISYLSKTDMIVVMRNGVISELGSYDDLLSRNGAFAEFITTYLQEAESDEEEDPEIIEVKKALQRTISIIHNDDDKDSLSKGEKSYERSFSDKGSSKKSRNKSHKSRKSVITMTEAEREDTKKEFEKQAKQQTNKRLTEEEMAATGTVKGSIFITYLRACGFNVVLCVLFWYLVTLAAQVYANIWLSLWSQDQAVNGTQDIPLRNLRLGVYGGVGLVQGLSTLAQSFSLAIATISSSRILHSRLMQNILRAPMAFFDTTPLGRIINRFSKDVDTVDVNIPITIRIWMATASVVITTIFVISYSTPIFLAIMLPLGIFYYFVQRFYISTSRQLKRIDSVRRSPIYAHFSESLSGGSSIRAYGVEKKFIQRSDTLLDQNQMTYYPNIVSNRWLGVWLESIGNSVVLFAAILAVTSTSIDAGLAGLSVSYALQVTGALNMMVRMTSDMENYVVAVERIEEYVECPQEAPNIVEGNRPDRSWPPTGTVVFKDYATRYRQGLDLVLNDINCEFQPGEKVGIVGRTGAGKSSLTLALFRIIEAATGRIVIDGVKIDKIGLHDLRSKLTIIPQDPVIFAGTLRMNLDPFERHSDSEIWSALEHAHLKTFVETNLTAGLEHQCSEGGENLSVGQRQLVCLARALLRKTRILVLDEATAAIDMETDDLIQTTIRTQFTESTVITIAHRLNTIMDYDRVLVLDKGRIVEYDSPSNLLKSKGIFYDMAKDAGLINQGNVNTGFKS